MVHSNDKAFLVKERDLQLAAIYVASKAAKELRDLKRECADYLYGGECDFDSPSRHLLEALAAKGVEWETELYDYSEPALSLLAGNTEALSLAVDELADYRGIHDDGSDEYEAILFEATEEAERAIGEAEKTKDEMHEVIADCKSRMATLYALKERALAELDVPFIGFHPSTGDGHDIAYAYFAEGPYGFHIPVRRVKKRCSLAGDPWDNDLYDEHTDCWSNNDNDSCKWEMTGIPAVDAELERLNASSSQPEFVSVEKIGLISARIDADKSLGLSTEEAVAILESLVSRT